jgi:hypothetical protein
MKFTQPNENGILTNKMFDTSKEAFQKYGTNYVPVVSLDEWARMHKDYKTVSNGIAKCLYLDHKSSTVLSEVYVVGGL